MRYICYNVDYDENYVNFVWDDDRVPSGYPFKKAGTKKLGLLLDECEICDSYLEGSFDICEFCFDEVKGKINRCFYKERQEILNKIPRESELYKILNYYVEKYK